MSAARNIPASAGVRFPGIAGAPRVDMSPLGLALAGLPGLTHYFDPAIASGLPLRARDFASGEYWTGGAGGQSPALIDIAYPMGAGTWTALNFNHAANPAMVYAQRVTPASYTLMTVVGVDSGDLALVEYKHLIARWRDAVNVGGLMIVPTTSRVLFGPDASSFFTFTAALATGFSFLMLSYDHPTKTAVAYVNKANSGESHTFGAAVPAPGNWTIGGYPGADFSWSGSIAPVAIFEGTALHLPAYDTTRNRAAQAFATYRGVALTA